MVKVYGRFNLQHDFNQRRAGVADEGLQKPCRHDLSHGPKGPDTLGRKRLPCRMLPSRSGEGLVGECVAQRWRLWGEVGGWA